MLMNLDVDRTGAGTFLALGAGTLIAQTPCLGEVLPRIDLRAIGNGHVRYESSFITDCCGAGFDGIGRRFSDGWWF